MFFFKVQFDDFLEVEITVEPWRKMFVINFGGLSFDIIFLLFLFKNHQKIPQQNNLSMLLWIELYFGMKCTLAKLTANASYR